MACCSPYGEVGSLDGQLLCERPQPYDARCWAVDALAAYLQAPRHAWPATLPSTGTSMPANGSQSTTQDFNLAVVDGPQPQATDPLCCPSKTVPSSDHRRAHEGTNGGHHVHVHQPRRCTCGWPVAATDHVPATPDERHQGTNGNETFATNHIYVII